MLIYHVLHYNLNCPHGHYNILVLFAEDFQYKLVSPLAFNQLPHFLYLLFAFVDLHKRIFHSIQYDN